GPPGILQGEASNAAGYDVAQLSAGRHERRRTEAHQGEERVLRWEGRQDPRPGAAHLDRPITRCTSIHQHRDSPAARNAAEEDEVPGPRLLKLGHHDRGRMDNVSRAEDRDLERQTRRVETRGSEPPAQPPDILQRGPSQGQTPHPERGHGGQVGGLGLERGPVRVGYLEPRLGHMARAPIPEEALDDDVAGAGAAERPEGPGIDRAGVRRRYAPLDHEIRIVDGSHDDAGLRDTGDVSVVDVELHALAGVDRVYAVGDGEAEDGRAD